MRVSFPRASPTLFHKLSAFSAVDFEPPVGSRAGWECPFLPDCQNSQAEVCGFEIVAPYPGTIVLLLKSACSSEEQHLSTEIEWLKNYGDLIIPRSLGQPLSSKPFSPNPQGPRVRDRMKPQRTMNFGFSDRGRQRGPVLRRQAAEGQGSAWALPPTVSLKRIPSISEQW